MQTFGLHPAFRIPPMARFPIEEQGGRVVDRHSLDKQLKQVDAAFEETFQPSQVLQRLVVQQIFMGYISEPFIEALCQEDDVQNGEISALIEFYHFLQLKPAAFRIYWSNNIIDENLGQKKLADKLELFSEKYPVDLQVSPTSCVGLSDQAPAMLVNHYPLTSMTSRRVKQLLTTIEKKRAINQWPKTWFTVKNFIGSRQHLLYKAPSLEKTLAAMLTLEPGQILELIEDYHLLGCGGAAFPTAKKWRLCQEQTKQPFIICNADEGEPGTFKDRLLLTHYLDKVIAGMIIAGYTLNANVGLIYLRFEYLYLFNAIQDRLEHWRGQSFLSVKLQGKRVVEFDIRVVLGAGAYVCGEETALIESIEGKPGIPRIRPPYPLQSGLLGKPTLVNNVETFARVAHIVGSIINRKKTEKNLSPTVLHSISGTLKKPGIYELATETSLKQVLDCCQATKVRYCQVAGPSGYFYDLKALKNKNPNMLEKVAGGSLMLFDEYHRPIEITKNFIQFFRFESCGFCTPCRVGTQVLADILDKICRQQALPRHYQQLEELAELMKHTSLCGLGQSAGNTIKDCKTIDKSDLIPVNELKSTALLDS